MDSGQWWETGSSGGQWASAKNPGRLDTGQPAFALQDPLFHFSLLPLLLLSRLLAGVCRRAFAGGRLLPVAPAGGRPFAQARLVPTHARCQLARGQPITALGRPADLSTCCRGAFFCVSRRSTGVECPWSVPVCSPLGACSIYMPLSRQPSQPIATRLHTRRHTCPSSVADGVTPCLPSTTT